ncbi:hypothetical protein ACTXT7_009794 [Hymenolepis weldensis]
MEHWSRGWTKIVSTYIIVKLTWTVGIANRHSLGIQMAFRMLNRENFAFDHRLSLPVNLIDNYDGLQKSFLTLSIVRGLKVYVSCTI